MNAPNNMVDNNPSKEPYPMRAPCVKCGSEIGYLTPNGMQDTVRCLKCDRYAYHAPRTETGRAVRTVKTTHEDINPKLRAFVIERAGTRCETCNKTGPDAYLEVGHIISVIDGHRLHLTDEQINNVENLIAQCKECNLGFGSRTLPLHLAQQIVLARVTAVTKDR